MAKQTINIGTSANSRDGDPIRNAFTKINQNFDELYAGNFADPEAIGSAIKPDTDATYDLGASDKQWADLYVRDFIYLNGVRLEGANGNLLVEGAAITADTQGSVFGDDSTLLVDSVAGKVVGPIEAPTITSSSYVDASSVNADTYGAKTIGSFVNLGVNASSIKVVTDIDMLTFDITNATNINATTFTGDLTGSVFSDDSGVIVDGVNNKLYAGTVTTLAVFGNPTLALNANVIALDAQSGNLTLQTTDTITNNFVNLWEVQGISASMELTDDGVNSELGLNVDVVDFGTGNTIDMQNCSVLLSGTTFTDEPWISLADLKTVVAASIDFTDFQARIAAL